MIKPRFTGVVVVAEHAGVGRGGCSRPLYAQGVQRVLVGGWYRGQQGSHSRVVRYRTTPGGRSESWGVPYKTMT